MIIGSSLNLQEFCKIIPPETLKKLDNLKLKLNNNYVFRALDEIGIDYKELISLTSYIKRIDLLPNVTSQLTRFNLQFTRDGVFITGNLKNWRDLIITLNDAGVDVYDDYLAVMFYWKDAFPMSIKSHKPITY
jgi:hypothetical protein